jgi:hypothetical protein
VGSAAYALLPLTAARLTMDVLKPVRTVVLAGGGGYCDLVRNRTTCGDAMVIELAGIVYGDRDAPRVTPPYNASLVNATVRIIIWAGGAISVHVVELVTPAGMVTSSNSSGTTTATSPVERRVVDGPLPVHPAAVCQLRGSPDARGARTVAWPHLRPGVVLTFTPSYACPDCSGRGYCNTTTNTCVCAEDFDAWGCRRCKSGYYGADCQPCRDCLNGGTCDDGLSGTGICKCVGQWSGRRCETQCASSDPAVTQCNPGCNPTGGYCQCGTCVCDALYGWGGRACAEWTDPCLALALYGCKTCVAHPNVSCDFCLNDDYRCLASTRQATAKGLPLGANSTRCKTAYMSASNWDKCPAFKYSDVAATSPPSTRFDFVMFAVIMGLVAAAICALAIFNTVRTPIGRNPLYSARRRACQTFASCSRGCAASARSWRCTTCAPRRRPTRRSRPFR